MLPQRAASVAARVPRAAWVWLDSVDRCRFQSVPYFMHAGARPRGRSHSVLCSPPLQPGAARGSARGNCSFCSRVCCSCGLRPTVELVRLRFFSAWRTSKRGPSIQWLPGLDRPPRLPLRTRPGANAPAPRSSAEICLRPAKRSRPPLWRRATRPIRLLTGATCRDPGPSDLQSDALPTELSRLLQALRSMSNSSRLFEGANVSASAHTPAYRAAPYTQPGSNWRPSAC